MAIRGADDATCTEALSPLDVRVHEWVDRVLQQLEKTQSVVDIYSLSAEHVNYVWANVASWLLVHDRERLLEFLLATMDIPLFRGALGNCMDVLIHIASRSRDVPHIDLIQRIVESVCALAQRGDARRLRIEGFSISRLLRHCSPEQALRMYGVFHEHGVHMTGFTYCHFVNLFAKHGLYNEAREALLVASERIYVNTWAFRTVCSTLLRRSIEQPDGLRETLNIISTFVDIGVMLDQQMCDITMLNAVEAGDIRTAFNIYYSLKERGLQPTQKTFSILLKACKSNIDDRKLLDEVIREAVAHVDVRHSHLVADNIMHCLALGLPRGGPSHPQRHLTNIYAQFYDLAPLQQLGIPLTNVDLISEMHSQKLRRARNGFMTPSPQALAIMISFSFRNMSIDGGGVGVEQIEQVWSIYQRWRTLVEAGDPIFAPLATTDHVANIFLCFFRRKKGGMDHAAAVMRDMQRSLPSSAGVEQARPTAQSWNIFLEGFARSGRMELAEQVRTYMCSKGIKEDTVTWNTLLSGYSRAQDLDGAMDVLRRGHAQGATWDEWSTKVVRQLEGKDRQVVEDMIATMRTHNPVDFTADLKDQLEERLTRDEVVDAQPRAVEGFGDSPGEVAEADNGYKPFHS